MIIIIIIISNNVDVIIGGVVEVSIQLPGPYNSSGNTYYKTIQYYEHYTILHNTI